MTKGKLLGLCISLGILTISSFCYSQNIFREGYFVKESMERKVGDFPMPMSKTSDSLFY